MKRCLVIIPTYNEADNLPQLLPTVLKLGEHFNILIVDDGSPDGTGKLVKEMQKTEPRIHLIERPGKMGLGTAYVAGFKYAIANSFDFVFHCPQFTQPAAKLGQRYTGHDQLRFVSLKQRLNRLPPGLLAVMGEQSRGIQKVTHGWVSLPRLVRR